MDVVLSMVLCHPQTRRVVCTNRVCASFLMWHVLNCPPHASFSLEPSPAARLCLSGVDAADHPSPTSDFPSDGGQTQIDTPRPTDSRERSSRNASNALTDSMYP